LGSAETSSSRVGPLNRQGSRRRGSSRYRSMGTCVHASWAFAPRLSGGRLGRRACTTAGLPPPRFKSVSLDEDVRSRVVGFPYPAVVKPLALSGSRGVMRVDNADKCVEGLGRLRRLLA